MDNKQTAVQWLEKELQSKLIKIVLENDYALIDSLFQQALQMERKQIEEAFDEGNPNGFIDKTGEDHYNQTYTQNNN